MTRPRDPEGLKSCCASLYELPITRLLLGPSFHPGGPALTRALASAALVERDSHVLDVACGTGESARVVAEHSGCRVTGLDYSQANVALAAELSAQAPLSGRVRFVHGDAEALPFEDGSFDVVMCECALCTFPDRGRALAEMRRVLAPGGRVAISDVLLEAAIPPELDDVLGHALCIAGALGAGGYRRALEAAGFAAVRFRNASDSIRHMLDDIEQRATRARDLAAAGRLELPQSLEGAEATFAAARRFIDAGGLGYGMLVARVPRNERRRTG